MQSKPSRTKPKPKSLAPLPAVQLVFEAIGTTWTIDIFDVISTEQARILRATVIDRIELFDKAYSRFRDDSLVTVMAKSAGTFELPSDAKPLLDLYQHMYEISKGAVTPLVGQLLEEAGYDANYSLQPKTLHAVPAWDTVLEYDFPKLILKKPAVLDFGAAGKGYLVDIVGAVLDAHDIRAYCVDAGGDMICRPPHGTELRIGLEHPAAPGQVIGVATLERGSICGSAGNRRSWGMGEAAFHHIMDPIKRESPRHVTATWVVADTTLLADMLTTALFFVPAQTLKARYTFEYAVVHADFSLTYSDGFPATFFTDSKAALSA